MQKSENEIYSYCLDNIIIDMGDMNGMIVFSLPDNLVSFLDNVDEKYIDYSIMIGYSRPYAKYYNQKTFKKLESENKISNIGVFRFTDIKVHFTNKKDFLKLKLYV